MRNSLPERRQERGWSQQRLADELGVSRQTVISIENGQVNEWRYWRLSPHVDTTTTAAQWQERVRAQLEESVRM